MENEKQLIVKALKEYHDIYFTPGVYEHSIFGKAALILENDAVPVNQYNELREAFVDYVCSGITNPASYCKNKCKECVDSRGWCKTDSGGYCRGFNPDRETGIMIQNEDCNVVFEQYHQRSARV